MSKPRQFMIKYYSSDAGVYYYIEDVLYNNLEKELLNLINRQIPLEDIIVFETKKVDIGLKLELK